MVRGRLHVLPEDLEMRWTLLDETFERWRACWSGDGQPTETTSAQTASTTASSSAAAQSVPASVGGGRSG